MTKKSDFRTHSTFNTTAFHETEIRIPGQIEFSGSVLLWAIARLLAMLLMLSLLQRH